MTDMSSATTTPPTSTSTSASASASASTHEIRQVEGLRAVAALGVMLTHAGFLSGAVGRDVLPGFLARLDIGVAVFFVLSGFLLYRPHARAIAGGRPALRTRDYLLRRMARLLPAWLVCLVGAFVLVPDARYAPAVQWLANLLQLQAIKFSWDLPGLAQLWSLSTEIGFYLALPLIAWSLRSAVREWGPRAEWLGLLVFVGVTWAFRMAYFNGVLPGSGISWLRTLPANLDWFVMGMALAALLTDSPRRRAVRAVVRGAPLPIYALAAVLFWLTTSTIAGPYDLTRASAWQDATKHLAYAVVGLLLVAPAVVSAVSPVGRFLASRAMVYLGTISYGVFLWHLPIMFAVREALGYGIFDGHFWATVIVTGVLTTVIATLSWRWVEEPVQRWARSVTSPRPTLPTATPVEPATPRQPSAR